ncbi:MAG: hypothetical protein L3J88_01045 [Gammaproteobacteria bacterium]|nr:hypothetical protein [Gammaproteobacteria bacterium]MCF6361954.1 hypothetical protein [Gammaproteobacteria bacterium]
MKHYPLPRLSRLIPLIAVLLLSGVSQAGMITGYVYTRAPVLSEAGHFIWAEYAPDSGEFISELAEAAGDWAPEQWRVLSGAEYQTYIDQYQALIDRHPGLEAPLSRSAYESAIFYLADGITEMSKPALKHPGTAYVSVLPQSVRYLDDPGSLVLDEYPVDPTDTNAPNNASMLVRYNGSPRGEIKAATPNRLGFRTAFIKDRDGNVLDVPDRWFEQGMKRRPGQGVVGPISNVVVEGLMMGRGASVSDGKYVTMWHSIPCPIIPYSIDGYATATLRYRRFDPRAQGFDGVYFVMRPLVESCQPDFFMVPFFGPFPLGLGTVTTYPLMMDFPIDVMVLSGVAQMPVPVGQTQYRASDPDHDIPQGNPNYYDFDDDGLTDTIILGRFETDADSGEEIFVLGTDGIPEDLQRQGVFLSSSGAIPGEDLPDLTRVIDRASFDDLRPQGLLSEISAEDLRNTDLYVVRVADGRLIAERIGLNEYEADRISNFGENAESSQFFYSLQMRNSFGDLFRYASGGFRPVGLNFSKWQSTSGINPALHQRQADHLQPGDLIRLYAINRATGYLGVTTTVMQAAGSDGLANLAFRIDPIQMRPPNLKIWAERGYDIQAGLRKGDIEQDQVIGYEGAALTSDNYLKITTEWLDPQGRPLPSALQGAGYTGRIAILSSDKTLANNNQGVYQFAIEPGQHLQVLQLPNNLATDQQHYYLHVSGEPQSGNPIFTGTDNVRIGVPDFSSSGQNPGILEKRPDNYVPFLVPVFDETGSELQRRVYRQMKRDNPEQAFTKPEPIYRWAYRPEFQFSNYQLTMKEMRAENYAADGSLEDSADLLNVETPVLSSDNLLSLLYNLETTELLPLDYLNAGPEKELIFTLGEQEIKVTLGTDQTLRFDDLSHLNSLDPEDYLTLRLYANNDMGNVLWAWAFEAVNLIPPAKAGEIEISADDNTAILNLTIPGYQSRDPAQKTEYSLVWRGGGVFSPSYEVNRLGAYSTQVTLPRIAGSTVVVEASLNNAALAVKSATYKVVPGKPRIITVNQSGHAAVAGLGAITAQIRVQDQWGNNVADGTAVSVTADTDISILGNTSTVDGYINLVLKGVETAGTKNLTIQAGDATQTAQVTIAPIDLTINLPGNVPLDSTVNVSLQATSSVGPVDGTVALLRASFGELSSQDVVFTNGVANVQLYGGLFRGTGTLSAQVGANVQAVGFTVAPPGGAHNPELAQQVLMGDVTTSGTLTVDAGDDTVASFDYVAETTLTVNGTPGETVPVSLGSLSKPIIEPVLEYPMYSLGPNQTVFDRYEIIHATASDVVSTRESRKGFRGSYDFTAASAAVRIPNHRALDKASELGFSLSFKATDAVGTLVNYDLRKQRLSLTTDSRVQYQIETADGTFTVTSAPIALNAWHDVAAHYKENQLWLEVDGVLTTIPATGALVRQTSTTAIRLGSGYGGLMSDFRVIDWTLPILATFADGSTSTRVTIGTSGSAQVMVKSTGQMGNRSIAMAEPGGFDIAMGFFVRTAHADIWGAGAAMWNSIQVGAETAFFGLIDTAKATAAVYEGVVRGVFLGDTSTAAGATADFIIGFIPFVGDGRDIALQKYYEWSGSENYDELIQILAYIGFSADTASAIGILAAPVTGGSSVTLTVIGQTFKNTARVLKTAARFIPNNSAFRKVLIAVFREALAAAKKGNWNRIANTLVVVQLFYAVLGDDDIRNLLLGAIQTPEDFNAWVDYLLDFDGVPETVVFNHQSPILDFFFSPAHAAPTTVFVQKLVDLLAFARRAELVDAANGGLKQIGRELTEAIKILRKHGQDAYVYPERFKNHMLNSLVSAMRVSPEKGMEGIVKAALDRRSAYLHFLGEFSGLLSTVPRLRLQPGEAGAVAGAGLKRVLTDLASTWQKRQGAVHHIFVMTDAARRDIDIIGIEVAEAIISSAKRLPRRVYDSVHRIGTRDIRIDAKSWSPGFAADNLVNSLRWKPVQVRNKITGELANGVEKPGQLFLDIVQLYNKRREANFGIHWVFDARSAGKVDGYVAAVMKELRAGGETSEKMRRYMGLSGSSKNDEWNNFLDRVLEGKLSADFFKVIE